MDGRVRAGDIQSREEDKAEQTQEDAPEEIPGYHRHDYPSMVEKPNKFDPFGQKESAHLIYHTIAPLKVLVMGVNFILPF